MQGARYSSCILHADESREQRADRVQSSQRRLCAAIFGSPRAYVPSMLGLGGPQTLTLSVILSRPLHSLSRDPQSVVHYLCCRWTEPLWTMHRVGSRILKSRQVLEQTRRASTATKVRSFRDSSAIPFIPSIFHSLGSLSLLKMHYHGSLAKRLQQTVLASLGIGKVDGIRTRDGTGRRDLRSQVYLPESPPLLAAAILTLPGPDKMMVRGIGTMRGCQQ